MRLELGSPVQCTDGPAGELADLVIDPGAQRVTHVVVQPHGRHDLARLVPLDRASQGPDGGISLSHSVAEIERLQPLQKREYLELGELPDGDGDSDIGIEESSAFPYEAGMGLDGFGGAPPIDYDPHVTVGYDRIPKGTVEVRRESAVNSSEGDYLGRLVGVVLGPGEQIADVILEHGHLWGKHHFAIPLANVARIQTDEVELSLSADQVGKLKPLPKHRG